MGKTEGKNKQRKMNIKFKFNNFSNIVNIYVSSFINEFKNVKVSK